MKTPIKISAMRHSFVVERKLSTQGSHNETIRAYDDVSSFRGELKTLGGRQLNLSQSNTVTSTATHRITARYSADVAIATTRLKLTSTAGVRTFEINHLDDLDGMGQWMVLTVTEVKS